MTDPNQQKNKPTFPVFPNTNSLIGQTIPAFNMNNNNQAFNTSTAQNNSSNGNMPIPNNSSLSFNANPGSSNAPNFGTDLNKNQSSIPSNPFLSNSTNNNLGSKPNTGIVDPFSKPSNLFPGSNNNNLGFPSNPQNNTLPSTNQPNTSEQNMPSKNVFGAGSNTNSMFGGITSEKPSFPQPSTINSGSSFLNINPNSNGLDSSKTTNPVNPSGSLTSSTFPLNKALSFGINQNQNSIAGNTTITDKPIESTNATGSNFQANPINSTAFSNIMARPTTNPEQPKETDVPKNSIFSKPKEDSTQKVPFSFNGDKGNSNNQSSLFSSLNKSGTNPLTNPAESKPTIGNFSKTELNSNLTANTGSKESDLGSKINFGFAAKQEGTNTNTDKNNETANFFTKEKKESSTDANTQNKPSFSLNPKQESGENIQTNTSKPMTNPNPNELFNSKATVQAVKIEKNQDRKETDKKEESKNISLIFNIVKISDPKEMPKISSSLEDVAINSMMKKSIEEVINHWKNELDNQVDRFDSSADKLKNFEFMFRKHFETIVSLYELINNLKEDGNNTLRNLKDIALEEDQIIEQLNIMEKSLDQYLEIANNRTSQIGRSQVDGRDHIYTTATEIAKTVDDIQKDIDEVNSKISERNVVNKDENLHVMSYENTHLKESISMDKNEFTNILNSYYASLRSIQFMEQNLTSKIMQADVELNEIRREREREKY